MGRDLHITQEKKNQREKQCSFHRPANTAAASQVKFIFNAHQKAPAAPHTAFNYFAYYCVVVRQKQGRTHYTPRNEDPELLATGAAEGTLYLL